MDSTSTGRRRLQTTGLIALAVAAGLAVAILVLPRVLSPYSFAGTEFPNPAPAPTLDGLDDEDGNPADLADFEGDVVLMYFGYLSCPDVCPTTLSTVARAMELLGPDADRVQLLMVSVDPGRDQLDQIRSYVTSFDESFAGLGAPEPALGDVASRWGIYYKLGEPDSDGNYDVEHTATLTGVDANGDLRILWSFDTTAEALAEDIRHLL